MNTLNLVNAEISSIKYIISKFPDGQQNIVIEPLKRFKMAKGANTHKLYDIDRWFYPAIEIKSRLNNWLDLELIVCAVACLREFDRDISISLYVPYFIGARSDRSFQEGGNHYLKSVVCPIINSLNFKTVTVLDPHSYVLEGCLNYFKPVSNFELVRWSLAQIKGVEDIIVVSPDEGASKKIYKLMEKLDYEGDIIVCDKERNERGEVVKTIVPYEFSSKDIIIIDDICDGGAKVLRSRIHGSVDPRKIYLIVTHGIFSKGFSELSKYFDGIYCTNSYKEVLKGSFYNYDTKNIVKQLNVF
jgi:ribose-phosphate pyrophosphokinase